MKFLRTTCLIVLIFLNGCVGGTFEQGSATADYGNVQKPEECKAISEDQIKIHTTLLGGAFGRRLMTDFVIQALIVSKSIKKPDSDKLKLENVTGKSKSADAKIAGITPAVLSFKGK